MKCFLIFAAVLSFSASSFADATLVVLKGAQLQSFTFSEGAPRDAEFSTDFQFDWIKGRDEMKCKYVAKWGCSDSSGNGSTDCQPPEKGQGCYLYVRINNLININGFGYKFIIAFNSKRWGNAAHNHSVVNVPKDELDIAKNEAADD
jgi:hypothetical protein